MPSLLFLSTSLLIVATPGPDSALVTKIVLCTGKRLPAAVAALGMITAGALHAALAVSGVSLLLRANPALFTLLRWGGAAVLLLWGLTALWAAARPAGSRHPRDRAAGGRTHASLRRCFGAGLLCTGSNPKVGLFLVVYLPQFVPPGSPWEMTMGLLSAVHLGLGALWLGFLISAVHRLRKWAATRWSAPRAQGAGLRVADGVMGVVFISFAARLVWSS
ncbi:LysE family translocator [Streptomyces purpurogeneiscleroticus]|uniref:LysE family translocator n=1 Tax=Streptomyces purpurogeneiscleroticus TaxID=68259 RepID=UPI001CBC1F49|nr:LysE family translocator [Streptomyces purpurogeneiscleroticus]MBZ4018704.1 hypothetical protein [Streptomyces purpurogeneiscleroticus]